VVTTVPSTRVAIVGAGIGGLALAHGLLAAGFDVQVYEQEPTPRHRRQGYRIHISEVGEEALAALLPASVHRRVVDTATRPGDLLAGFDSQLVPVFQQVFPVTDADAVRAVDRHAFRRALMTGLDAVLHFGRALEGYVETPDGGIELLFADGHRATADVVVGADGVGSRVRAQLLPDRDVVDIGVRCVYGQVPLAAVAPDQVPPDFLRGFCFLTGSGGVGAAFAPVLFREAPAEYGDYLMAVVTGTNQALGLGDDELFALPPEDLWSLVVELTADWHPAVHRLVAAGDAAAAFPIVLRSCTRVGPWRTGRVTLLGDAVHPMTPAAGAGANTALRDAALLTRALAGARAGALVDALAAYETEMTRYAAEVVTTSLRNAEQMFDVRVRSAHVSSSECYSTPNCSHAEGT
jgi:2-polyprenyl-6-methoxyphenol hydroxylase-like FAD-dependent oxidoreductase